MCGVYVGVCMLWGMCVCVLCVCVLCGDVRGVVWGGELHWGVRGKCRVCVVGGMVGICSMCGICGRRYVWVGVVCVGVWGVHKG